MFGMIPWREVFDESELGRLASLDIHPALFKDPSWYVKFHVSSSSLKFGVWTRNASFLCLVACITLILGIGRIRLRYIFYDIVVANGNYFDNELVFEIGATGLTCSRSINHTSF
ncbi:hypothetical protein SLA2020_219100 [Shorea laevis]